LTAHATQIELVEPPPAEVLVGADLVLTVNAACAEGCDLSALPLEVIGPDGDRTTADLKAAGDGPDGTAEIALKIPPRVGEHVWRVSLAPREDDAICHDANALTITLRAKAHDTSLAVWDIPSPVVAGERLAIKAGAKSSAACALAGRRIEVCDDIGAVVARATLNATPWPATTALYWADLDFTAPAETGLRIWTVNFDPAELDLPHQGTAAQFSVVIVARPEHRLTVTVMEQDSKAPIADVHVRLGAYRGATDANGSAEIAVAKGRYDIHIWKVGFEADAREVEIEADFTVAIEAAIVPEEDPDAIWKM
jgi:hypothetical protein